MGIGTGILNALGRSLDSQYRREFEVLARAAFAEAPIDTAERLFGQFSHGGIIEALIMKGFSRRDAQAGAQDAEFEIRGMFNSAKVGGPGSPSDRSVRAMVTTIAAATAKQGPIFLVAGLSEVFKEIRNRNWATDCIDDVESNEKILMRAASRSQYLRDKYDEMT
jgi:hypothetical protein